MSKANYKIKSNREIRSYAKECLIGKMTLPVIISIFYVLSRNSFDSLAAIGLFGSSIFSLVFFCVMSLVLDTVIGIFDYGITHFYLSLVTGRDISLYDIFKGYRTSTDRIMGFSFILALLRLLCLLPYYIISFIVNPDSMLGLITCLVLSLLGALIYFLLSLILAPGYYILCDIPDVSLPLVFVMSLSMMNGKRYFKLLLLKISYIPLLLLGYLSLGVGLLFVNPFMYAAEAFFYEDLCDEYESKSVVA